jgi:DcuC family C4-dicarboxylate transporter
MTIVLGLLIVAAAIYAIVRKGDVRLVLVVAALALGVVAGKPAWIVDRFFATLTNPQFVIPLCCAMGFAHVLRYTLCDQHLVHWLVQPLRRARLLLIPGAVLVAFIVNIPVISQSSCAIAVGSVLVPLLLAARISPITAGAALLLGASIGGELLNPGAPEFRTVVKATTDIGMPVTGQQCVRATFPLDLLHLAVATGVFWLLSRRIEAAHLQEHATRELAEPEEPATGFKVNPLKALVPLLPLVLLFLTGPPLNLVSVPHSWLLDPNDAGLLLKKAGELAKDPVLTKAAYDSFDSRQIGAAMLIGAVAAALTDLPRPGAMKGAVGAFYEGAGFAFAHPIAIIVAATCFGEGIKQVGFDVAISHVIGLVPAALIPAAGMLPLGFGVLSGSGMAATQSLYGSFVKPAVSAGVPLDHLGAVVALASAAGRTMSPVAVVTLMAATLTETNPVDLVRRVAAPLLAGLAVVVVVASLIAPSGPRGAIPPAESAPPPAAAPSNAPPPAGAATGPAAPGPR